MHERWLILAVLTIARTVMGFQFQSAAAVSTLLIDQFHVGYTALGTLIGLYLFPGVAVALPGSMLAQRYGDKRIVCAGLAAMSLGGLLMASADNFTILTAGRVSSGIGAVLLNVLVTKMVTDWFQGREIVLALGILVTSWPLGIAIALVLLPALSTLFSWSWAMSTTAALSAAALALVVIFYRIPPTGSVNPPGSIRFDLTRDELWLATLAGLVWTFYNIGFILVLAFGTDFLIASGHSPTAASATVSTVGWFIIPALAGGAWLAQRIGHRDITMVACFSLSALLIWCVAGLGSSLVLFAAIGLLFGPPGGLIMTLPGEAVRSDRRAIAMGLYFTCYYAGMGVLPALAGYTRDLTGSAAAPLWFAGAMLIVATASLLQFRLMQPRLPQTAKSI